MNVLAKNKENNKNNSKKDDNIKTTGQVIIRREVIVEDEPKEVTVKRTNRSDIGFTERKNNRSFNIVYRDKAKKPMTVSELFGIKEEPKKEEKVQKVEEKKKIEEKPKEVKKVEETKNT